MGESDVEVIEGEVLDDLSEMPEDESSVPFSKGKRGRVTDEPPSKREWPEELLERARDLIDESYITDGGDYRENEKGTIYWLDLDHLVAFEEADQEYDTDKEFWDWFRDYRKEHGIDARKTKTKWSSTRSFSNYEYKEKKDKGFTSWWSGWGYSASSENTRKLAIALGAVKSVVSVINNTGKRYVVRLSSEMDEQPPTSFTSFETQEVVISPRALLDTSIEETYGIEVTAGWGLHEASHVQETESIMPALLEPIKLEPLSVASILLNLLEDVRIERLTSMKLPGFADYFDKANAYLWDVTKKHAPTKWEGPLGNKVNVVTATTKWNIEFAELVAKANDPDLTREFNWFSEWNDRHQAKEATQENARESLIEALEHLKEDPETKEQMEEQAAAEAAAGSPQGLTEEGFQNLLKQLREALKNGNGGQLIEPCPSPGSLPSGQPIQLTQEQAEEIDQLIAEEMTESGLEVKPPGQHTPGGQKISDEERIVILRPQETDDSRAAYQRPGSLLAKLKQAFVFRKTAPAWSERALRSGSLDEDMLWKITGNDLRVFERQTVIDTPNTQVTMLIDGSGSMSGDKIELAQMLANTMLECLKTMRGVTVRVRSHTTDDMDAAARIYRIWEPGDPVSRIGLIGELEMGGTPDGHAIDWACQELVRNRKKDEDMVLFVLSDGMPNHALRPWNGPQHVKFVVDHFSKRGIEVVQIALDPYVTPAQQAMMYKNYIMYGSDSQLARELTRMLIRLFGGTKA